MSEERYAVLIGNSQFPKDPKLLQSLRCPPKDVAALNSILKSPKHGRFTDSVVLENKSSSEILPVINKILRRAHKDDLVLIYYSGHGKLSVTGALHLATSDTEIEIVETTSIPVHRIRDLMDASAANKLVLILDCCYSGKAGDAFLKGGVDDQLQEVSGGNGSRGIYLLTASTRIQVAQEKERDENSLLTKYLLDGIRDGKADFDDDGFVTISDLFKHASDCMRRESFQVPMKWDLNVQGDSLVIAVTGQRPGTRRSNEIEQLLYHRRRFRDRYIIAALMIGGALGGGAALVLLRVPGTLVLLGTDFLFTRLLPPLFTGAILGGSLALGTGLAAHLWKASEERADQTTPLRWIRKLGNASNVALLLSTVTFLLAYLFVTIVASRQLLATQLVPNFINGSVLGFGLSLAIYGQPTAGVRIGFLNWFVRVIIAGGAFALTMLPSVRGGNWALPKLAWAPGFYESQLSFNVSPFLQSLSERSTLLKYVAEVDAFLIGTALTIGVTIGLTKAADFVARWVENFKPDRE